MLPDPVERQAALIVDTILAHNRADVTPILFRIHCPAPGRTVYGVEMIAPEPESGEYFAA